MQGRGAEQLLFHKEGTVSQNAGEQREQYVQEKKQRRNRLLSRIGLLLLVVSLCSGGVSSFIGFYGVFSFLKPTSLPIVGPLPSPTTTLGVNPSASVVPTPTSPIGTTPTETIQTPTATSPANSTATTSTTPTAIPSPTPTAPSTPSPVPPPPNINVSPQSLDTSNCTNNNNSWTCIVTLSETADSQGNVNWSVMSDLSGVEYFPSSSGILSPGDSIMITITKISCQSGSFIFSGMEGETPVGVSWSCTPISALIKKQIPTPTPPTENQLISDTTMSNIKILSLWPHMTKDQSVEINVSLITTPNLSIQLTATPKENNSINVSISKLILVGTPNVTISDVFGPGYQVSAIAQLYGTAFDIQPGNEITRPLDQSIVSFSWNVLPKVVGRQIIVVSIMGQWTPKDGGKSKERLIGQPELSIVVDEVNATRSESFIAFGQITLGEVLLGLIGSVLNLPWILDITQKRRKERERIQRLTPRQLNTPPKPQRKKRRRH
jgi:hypothetical protein